MSSKPNALSQSSVSSPAAVSPVPASTRPFYWSVRRELWEYRSIYLAPLIATAVFLFGFFMALALPHHRHQLLASIETQQLQPILHPYEILEGLLMVVGMVVGAFYCLDALHGERRDRSILFWKSMPVSDLTTVLSKAAIPLVVLPAIVVGLSVVTHFFMLLVSSAVLAGSGLPVAPLWNAVSFVHNSFGLFYHILTIHVLWHAPFYCWFLLISAWARRTPFLWAFLPPITIAIVEKALFNTQHFWHYLMYRLAGRMEAMSTGADSTLLGGHLTPLRFLCTPGLWFGLLFAAACLFAAARLRRYRDPM
ncbi:MAG TPA: ABC transporter permease [Verrucomicrobiae bacterium]|nr:ABC transporter permease [Verrucomicrobiae bacterium]